MPIEKGCTHCGSDQHNTTECPMMLAEREAFEHMVRFNWASSPLHCIRDALQKDDPRYGQYVDDSLQSMWVGWQARAKQPASVAVPDDKRLRVALSYADHPFREDTVRCPADTKEELYNALTVIAAAYRHAIASPAVQPVEPTDTPTEGWPAYHRRKMATMLDLMRGLRDRYKTRINPQSTDAELVERIIVALEAAGWRNDDPRESVLSVEAIVRAEVMRWKDSSSDACQKMLAALRELRQLKAQQAEQKPAAYQYQARSGEWIQFLDQRHFDNTVADGTWPIRALYTAPPAAQDTSRLMEALEEISRSETAVGDIARSALAAHRAQQEQQP